MRKIEVLMAVILAAAVLPGFAAPAVGNAKPTPLSIRNTPPIPIYPKAALVGELNLSDQDILGIVKGVLRSISEAAVMPVKGKAIPPGAIKALSEVISGLKHVRVMVTRLQNTKADWATKVVDFYDRALSKGPWNRIFLDMSRPNSALAVYSLPRGDGLLMVKGKRKGAGAEITAARTVGRVDFVKLIVSVMNASASGGEKAPATPAPAPKAESRIPPAAAPQAAQ